VDNPFTNFPRAFEEDLSDMIAQESRKRQKRDEEKRGEKKERSYRF
jgi:splicing factor 3B subunit 2